MTELVQALALLQRVRELEAYAAANPLECVPWLPGQIEWLSDPGPKPKLMRTGVRFGKSTAAVGECIFRARGHHPFNPAIRKVPCRIAFITTDKQAQGVQIQRLFWELVPKHELLPTVEFSERTGFRGHVPVVQFKNGSSVTWYSAGAGPKSLQGSEYDYIQIDEPVSLELFLECENRVRNTGGTVGITLTPLHLPVPWLEKKCEDGLVTDHHFRLTPEAMVSPITGEVRRTKAGEPIDADYIAALRARRTDPSAPIEIDGEWEARADGQWFKCFDPARHVVERLPTRTMKWFLGIDYAAADRELGMCAVLTGVEVVDEGDGVLEPHMWVLDEVVVPGTTTMEVFASSIVRMLRQHSFSWHELDGVFGDNPVKTRHQVSSNIELSKWLVRKLGLKGGGDALFPKLLSAKEGAAASSRTRRSKDLRCRWMYAQIASDRVRIHDRCAHLKKGLQSWDYGDRHPYKDILDAWMYGLREQWTTVRARRSVARVSFR